jgi:hypothetical protein
VIQPTLSDALKAASRRKDLSATDRAHLERWAEDGPTYARIWRRLSTSANAHGMIPKNSFYRFVVTESLFIRRHAERVASGVDFNLREQQQEYVRHLDLATKADELGDYYEWAKDYEGIVSFFHRFFRPVDELQALHRLEAKLLRQRAGRPPKPAGRVSRQDRHKGHRGLRKVTAFIDFASNQLRDLISAEPEHEAIAALTLIAFPESDVSAESVRKALRPTTVAGRIHASRTLAGQKS